MHYRTMVFNDCVLGKSGQITNPTITNVNPVPYYGIHVCESINCKYRKNSQFTINRYLQLKTFLQYVISLHVGQKIFPMAHRILFPLHMQYPWYVTTSALTFGPNCNYCNNILLHGYFPGCQESISPWCYVCMCVLWYFPDLI